MHFISTALALGACLFTAGVAAQGATFTDWPAELHPGKPATVKWSGATSGNVKISLLKGNSTDLHPVDTITAEVDGEKKAFTWIPKDSLKDGSDYALAIAQQGITNYSGQLSVSHDDHKVPPSKGPNPAPSSSSPGSSPTETEVKKGNTSADRKSNSLADNQVVSGKATMSSEEMTGGASFNGVSVRLALGAVAALFYFTT